MKRCANFCLAVILIAMNGPLYWYYDRYISLQSWQDIKCAAKGKAAALTKDITHAGGGPPVSLELSEFQRRVADTVGCTNAIHGHPNVNESVIVFYEVRFLKLSF